VSDAAFEPPASTRETGRAVAGGVVDVSGTVLESGGGVYVVELDSGERVEASLRGRLKQEARSGSRVVIGDRVRVTRTGDAWTVEALEPRRTELVRRGRGGRTAKVLAANLDRVFVVVALRAPKASRQLIDRLLVLVESSGMHPILILNKAELEGAAESAAELREVYEPIGYEVVVSSVVTGEGLDQLSALLCAGSSAVIGPSGVGKSSLLNAVEPDLVLRTGALSRKTGTGRHTTVGSRLIVLDCGGRVADTPGFGDVGLWSVAPEGVSGCFPEMASLAEDCRFRGCTHLKEPDCGVRAALEDGRLDPVRYESYRVLREEAAIDAAR
jgi:ribosome biogenesis GTPase